MFKNACEVRQIEIRSVAIRVHQKLSTVLFDRPHKSLLLTQWRVPRRSLTYFMSNNTTRTLHFKWRLNQATTMCHERDASLDIVMNPHTVPQIEIPRHCQSVSCFKTKALQYILMRTLHERKHSTGGHNDTHDVTTSRLSTLARCTKLVSNRDGLKFGWHRRTSTEEFSPTLDSVLLGSLSLFRRNSVTLGVTFCSRITTFGRIKLIFSVLCIAADLSTVSLSVMHSAINCAG